MNISIIILSNLSERRDWLVHRLHYLDLAGYDGEILVGVWGGHEHIEYLENICRRLTGKSRISVVAQDSAAISPARILELARRSACDYVVIQGDDDFLVPSAVARPIATLEADPTVLCAQGRCITLHLSEGAPSAQFKFSPFPVWEATESDVVERYCSLMKHYSFTWHAVYRKSQFIERMEYMHSVYAQCKDFIFFEMMGDLYSVIKGKIVISDELFFLRGDHDQNGSKTLRKCLSFDMPPYLLLSPRFSETYKIFEAKCLELLQSMGVNTTEEETMRRILDGMISCMGRLFYKIRDRSDPGELEFQKLVRERQEVLLPVFESIFASHLHAENAARELKAVPGE